MIQRAEPLGGQGYSGPTRSRPKDPQSGTEVGDGLAWAANSVLAFFLALLHIPHLANPLGANRLDDSWKVHNYLTVLNHLAFGTSYVSTHGPLGFVAYPIEVNRGLLALSDVAQMGFATLLAWLLTRVLRKHLRVQAVAGTLIISAMLLPGMGFWDFLDFVVVICALMCLLAAAPYALGGESMSGNQLGPYLDVVAAGFLLTVAALMKVLWLPMLLGTMAMWGIWALRQRMFAALTCFILASGFTWFGVFAVAGGGVGSGLRWPVAEFPIVFGYAEAMSLEGSVAYAALAAAVAFLTAICGVTVLLRQRGMWWWIASIGLLWLIAFKEGFVRQDGHVFFFFATAPWCAFLLWSALRQAGALHWSSGCERSGLCLRVATASAVAVVSLSFFVLVGNLSTTIPTAPELRNRLADLREAVRFIRSESYSRTRVIELRRIALEERPDLAPLVPLLEGRRAFAWPWDGNAIVAAGGTQAFPPVPQEYSVYTPSLDSIDAEFFSSSNRPQLGLISVEAIDGRLPLQTAGLSFLRLLSCYRPTALSGIYLLVTSVPGSDACASVVASPPASTPWRTVRLGEWVGVPSVPQHVTMAQIRINPTMFGTLSTLVLRNTRPLYLRFQMVDGTTHFFRVVRRTLPDGVMVSAIPSNARELSELWLGRARNDVRAIALDTRLPLEWTSTFVIRFLEVSLAGGSGSTGALFTPREKALVAPPALQSLFAHDKAAEQAWMALSTIYRGREDLRRAFPEGSKDFAKMLLSWATTSGVTIDGAKGVLTPHKPKLELMYRLVASEKSREGIVNWSPASWRFTMTRSS